MSDELRKKAEIIRSRLGYGLLEIAERVPTTKKGPISELQQLQSFRRTNAKNFFDSSAPKPGQDFEFGSVILLDVFEREQEGEAHAALSRLFLRQDVDESLRNVFFPDHSPGPSRQFVGYVFRQQPHAFPMPTAVCGDLPSEVESVAIWVDRITPSLVVLTLYVNLTNQVTADLRAIQRSEHLPEVRFKYWLPLGRRRGWTMWSEDKAAMDASGRFRAQIRTKVERFFQRHWAGYFSSSRDISLPRLPAIEIFRIKDSASAVNDERWELAPCDWLISLGIQLSRHDTFRSDSLIFLWAATDQRTSSVSTLVINFEASSGSTTETVLMDLGRVVVADYLYRLHLRVTEALRRVYGAVQQPRFSRFDSALTLNRDLLQASMFVRRLSLEVRDAGRWLTEGAGSLDKLTGDHPMASRPTLSANLASFISNNISRLGEYSTLSSEGFTRYLTLQNISVNYRLQWTMLAAAVTSALVAIVTLCVEVLAKN